MSQDQVRRKHAQTLQKEENYHAWHYDLPAHSHMHHITEYAFSGPGPKGKMHCHPDFPEHWLFVTGDAIVHFAGQNGALDEDIVVGPGDLIITIPGVEHAITPLSDITLICFGPQE